MELFFLLNGYQKLFRNNFENSNFRQKLVYQSLFLFLDLGTSFDLILEENSGMMVLQLQFLVIFVHFIELRLQSNQLILCLQPFLPIILLVVCKVNKLYREKWMRCR